MVASKPSSTQPSSSTASDRVRASRDGDRFHYTWGAARLLHLLSPASNLQQVYIEGAGSTLSDDEPDGAEVIDLTEFYGPPDGDFTALEVRQFKHSTLRANQNLTLGEVCAVVSKFAKIDDALSEQHPHATICYSIVTNKPIAPTALEAVQELANGQVPADGSPAARVKAATGLNTETVASLCSRLDLRGREPGVTALRRGLDREVGGLTADTDLRVSASLVDLVASRASTEFSGPILKSDVLAAFGCREGELTPAPCLLDGTPFITRDAYTDLADRILETPGSMVLTAEGGVGKSTFARALPDLISDRADVIIYDCFGNGNYRNPAHPRHRHRDGLVQLATEMAGLGLCFPIVHLGNLAPEEYTKAFVRRLDHASEVLMQSGNRQLIIVVDAADNAVIAAEDNADSRSFARDLLRLQADIPPNVRIVLTCRPERLDRLEAPVGVVSFELPAYTPDETATVVSSSHPSATGTDVSEIHDRTAGNPRVVSTVLFETATIHDALARVTGLASATSALDSLMQAQVANAFNNAGRSRVELERAVQLLTLLRPSVPLDVLSELAGTQAASLRSFISDLGRGLVLDGQSVQFLDEPTETFFRKWHPATREVAAYVAAQLRALSGSSAYAASSLPEVLWSANLYDELLALVATDDALPSTSDIERAQVEHLRVEFGLRAAVQLRRTDSIVQLAMRAGAGRAGKGRQFTIIRDNPDLAGSWMDSRVLGELIASRELPESWPGSTLSSEAAMLAHANGRTSTARSRARQAASAITAWVRAPREQYSLDGNITPEQVAHIALALLRTDGPDSSARFLSSWRPAHFVLESSATLARVLISSASDEDISSLMEHSTHPALLLGVLGEMQRVGMDMDANDIGEVWKKLNRFRAVLFAEEYDYRDAEDTAFRGASWLCALTVRHSIADSAVVAELLSKCLPPSLPIGLGDRHGAGRSGLLFAVALRAELLGESLDVDHYRPTIAPAKRGEYDPARSNDEDLDRYLRPALSWLSAWAKYARGDLDPQATATLIANYSQRHSQDETWSMSNRIARQVLPLLGVASEEEAVTTVCNEAIQRVAARAPIAGALDLILGLRGDARFAQSILKLSNAARDALTNTTEDADGKADTLVRIARGLHRFSQAEAQSYFDQAVKAASGVGDDALRHWDAIVALTRAAAGIDPLDAIALAERVAHLGEAIEPIVYDGFDQNQFAAALAQVSGANVLRLMGQWRDRRFGTLDWQFRGLAEGDEALLSERPDLRIILASFSSNLDLNAALSQIDACGGLNATSLSTVNNLANRLGRTLDAAFAQTSLPDPPRVNASGEFRSATFDLTPDKEAERAAQLEDCKVQIAALDLTQASGVTAAVRIQQKAHSYGHSLLIADVFTRPMLQWGPILDAILSSAALNDYELAKLLNEALARPRTAQSFVDSLKKAVCAYVDRHGAYIFRSNWMSFDLPAAAELLGLQKTDLLQRALDHLNLEEALIDADHCYMLAAGASAVLAPSTAARVLDEALTAFAEKLRINPETAAETMPADPIDIAVANFLWAALGDPRSAVRWQAVHAVRTAVELGASDLVNGLGSAVIRGDAAGYADGRFHFYEMSAAEWFLVAVNRAARNDPSAIKALVPAIIELSDRYPDHALIQWHCSSIARLISLPIDRPIGTDWKSTLEEPVVLESWKRPAHPGPMMIGAPQAEHRFNFDFDEYVLGGLTKALVITHQEVLDSASVLILDEWGWRADGEPLEDPRRTAGTYKDGETYGYKWEIPEAEDLNYYLEHHAALTIAGRLMRTTTPYRDPDTEQVDVLEWLRDFDIARRDGRWVTDQRSPVPGPLATVGPRGRNQVHESEFLAALKPADGWVTIWQSASVTEYDRSLSIHIASALVTPEAAGALVRALQTADGYWSFRIPSADLDDERFQFSSPPFQLRGWVSTPNSEGGIDQLDPLANDLKSELPRPSAFIEEALSLTSRNGGLRWECANGDAVFASETWAEISVAREAYGPTGNRLRITTEALDQMLGQLDTALIVEVQVKRKNRRAHHANVSNNDNGGGSANHDNNFRVFSYQPGAGWNDFNGRVRTG